MQARYLLVLLSVFLLGADWAKHPVNQWVMQSPTDAKPAPGFSWEGSGSYDPFTKKWIHFGGHDGTPQGFHTFTYDIESGAWEQRFPPTSPPGVCCIDGANVFDVANRRFVNFPGGSLGHGYQWSRGVKLKSSAVWLYDTVENTWTNMRPAPYNRNLNPRDQIGGLDSGGTYDSLNELTISFGGQGSKGGTNNLHFYDAYSNKLHSIVEQGAPSPRDGMALCYDPKNECLVVFGSQYASDEKTHLFRTRTSKWESHDLKPRPNAVKGKTYSSIPRLAYDSVNETCLLLNWSDSTNVHETWSFDAGKLQWTKMNPSTEPEKSMSRSRNMSFSPEHNAFVLETNPSATKGKGAQIWTYRYKDAPPDKRLAAPANLEAVTDPGRVSLTWSAVAGAKKYHVYRAEPGEPWKLNFVKDAVTTETSHDVKIFKSGQTYFYKVRAVGPDGVEGRDSFRARSEPRVVLKPVVSVLSADKVEVTWQPHPAKDIAGYNIYRGDVAVRTTIKGEGKAWRDNDPAYDEPMVVEVRDVQGIKKLNDTPLTQTSFSDTVNLSRPGGESKDYKHAVHAYIVRAVNKLGVESGPSPYALTIPSEPTNVLNREKGTMAELKWDANPEKGIKGYHVYKLEGIWNIARVTKEPIQSTTFTHTSPRTRYWIVAVDTLGQEGQPSSPVWHGQSYKGFYKGDWHQ